MTQCATNLDMQKVETYIDGLNDIFTSTILESPPYHQIYFRRVFSWKALSDDGYRKPTQRNEKFVRISFARAICDDHLMILDAPRLAEVRRLENFLDGCQNRVGWRFRWDILCCGSRKIVFQGVVLSQFSKAVNSGDFCLAHLLTKRLKSVWRIIYKLETFGDALLKFDNIQTLKLDHTLYWKKLYTICFKTNTLTPIL